MSLSSFSIPPLARPDEARAGTVEVGIGAFVILQLATAVFMAAAPHAFYEVVGPFGAFNSHYIRDVSSFEGAIGLALLVALWRPSWRVPILALTTVQYGLHSVNHLVDIHRAHPEWLGYFDFFTLAASGLLLAWLWRGASLDAAARGSRP
jgi:hypothetical protein